MIVLLSPAKIQNFKTEPVLFPVSQPTFLHEAAQLVEIIREMSMEKLGHLLKVNFELVQLNAERFSKWQLPFTTENAKPAVQVFNGEVFHGLDVRSLDQPGLHFLNRHLRIFSGLYGLLKPFDLIQPYRIDFGDDFRLPNGQNLYAFWSDKITDELNRALDELDEPRIILNLASNEYIKGINRKKINATILNVDFLQIQPVGYKTIVVYTKKARGMMTRFVTENRLTDDDYLKAFDLEKYMWNQHLSTNKKLVFVR